MEEPADRFGGAGKMLGVLPRLEQLGGRRECGDLAAGLGGALADHKDDEIRVESRKILDQYPSLGRRKLLCVGVGGEPDSVSAAHRLD